MLKYSKGNEPKIAKEKCLHSSDNCHKVDDLFIEYLENSENFYIVDTPTLSELKINRINDLSDYDPEKDTTKGRVNYILYFSYK